MALFTLASVAAPHSLRAQTGSRVVPQAVAANYGLQRAWFTQIRLNPARSHVVNWDLSYDRLFVVTSAGTVQAIDVSSGRTLWTTQVGNPDYPSLGPAANARHVGLINGSTLYLLNRDTGREIWSRPVGGGPGAGPILSSQYAFVPLINGRMEGYSLYQTVRTPWYYVAAGRAMAQPFAFKDSVAWSTDAGRFYVGGGRDPGVRFRLETSSPVLTQAAGGGDHIYAATRSGDIYAVNMVSAALAWKYATGYPTVRSPVAVGGRVYLANDEPALTCLDESGTLLWSSPGVSQFVAVGKQHVYGLDPFSNFLVLDAETGALRSRVLTGGNYSAVTNNQSDRLLIMSSDGLLQCFHETGSVEPTYYVEPPTAAEQEAPPTQQEPAAPADIAASAPAAAPAPAPIPAAPQPTPENVFGEAPPSQPLPDTPPAGGQENPFEGLGF